MRARTGVLFCCLLTLLALGGWMGGRPVSARAQSTPTAEATAETTPAADTATTPEAGGTPTVPPVGKEVVTLVAWYQTDEAAGTIAVGPLKTNNALVAGADAQASRGLTGTVDFESADNDSQPRITLGESVFDAYVPFPDDPESLFRWIYTDDDPSVRPATMVLQINATAGPYKDYSGTATFISRSTPASGVLVIVLNPPSE